MNSDNIEPDWKPSASQEALRARAQMLTSIRTFFQHKNVLEVDTPSLSQGTITDVYLEPMTSQCQSLGQGNIPLYLQTSPEFAMKRLLASGSGCIYQICRAFRDDELGRFHNPEFLMLEWYRVDFDHKQLMSEMDELLTLVLDTALKPVSPSIKIPLCDVPVSLPKNLTPSTIAPLDSFSL